MSEASEAVFAAIERSAGLVDVPYSRAKVQQVLSAFGDEISEESVVVLAMAGGERHRGDIDYNFTVPTAVGDLYKIAVAHGFIEATDHPVATLLTDITERCRVSFYGVEAGLVGGFKKTYVFFPLDELGSLSKLAEIPAMPPAVAENAHLFERMGLADRISIVGIDYLRKTMNIYFMAGSLEERAALDLLADTGLPVPEQPMVDFIQNSFSIYPTFSWDDSQVRRICFSVVSPDDNAYPTTLDAEVSHFAKNAPHEYEGEPVLVFGETVARDDVYHKLGVYFRRPPAFWSSLPLAATFERLVAAHRGGQ